MKSIFIGGCPRSGTTLLGSMLGAHKQCLTTPESQFKFEALGTRGRPKNAADVQAALHRIIEHPRFKRWGISLEPNKVPEQEIGESYGRLLEWVVRKYGEHIGKKNFSVWVDHTPRNIKAIDALFAIFPEAKFIHIVRDGRAVAASVMRKDWGPNTLIGAAHWWVHNVSYGLGAESAFGTERIIRVKYEDLVTSPGRVMYGLCSWLGIDYDAEMAKGGGFKTGYPRPKGDVLFGKEPDVTRASAWQSELTPRQIELFESRTGEFLLYLGHELKYGLAARRASIGEMIRSIAVEPWMGAVNAIRFSYRHRMTVRMLREKGIRRGIGSE